MSEEIELTGNVLSRLLHQYSGDKDVVFERQMTNGRQEMKLIEIIHRLENDTLVFVLDKKEP